MPFEALGTRIPFLTPVVGARLPEMPPRPADAEDAALLLIVVFFILSDWRCAQASVFSSCLLIVLNQL